MEIIEMKLADYEQVASLWQGAEGIGLHSLCDSKIKISIYLQRNPGLSFVAVENGKIIGAVICGHDGRRGYLNHLVVAKEYRCRGIGTALVGKVIDKLRMIGIRRCNIFIFTDNHIGREFWKSLGWEEQDDLIIASKDITL